MHSNWQKRNRSTNLAPLAKAGVPLLHVCGSPRPWLASQTQLVEKRYQELGGRVSVIINEGGKPLPLAPKTLNQQ